MQTKSRPTATKNFFERKLDQTNLHLNTNSTNTTLKLKLLLKFQKNTLL